MTSDNPEASLLIGLFGLCLLALISASVVGWIAVITWFSRGGKSIPVEPRRPAPWGLIHFVAIFVLFVLIGGLTICSFDSLVVSSMIADQPLEQQESLRLIGRIFSGSFSQIITMMVATLMIAVSTRATMADLGWTVKRLGYDILLGIGASILFLPIIQILMASLVYLLDQKYDHPLLEALKSGPVLWMYLGAFFSAVIAAPITEEFLFRVILQGMLEANATSEFTWKRLLFGTMFDEPQDVAQATAYPSVPLPATAEMSTLKTVSQQSLPTSSSDDVVKTWDESASQVKSRATATTVPIWPLFVSGILFGLAHAEYGPSWFPLILMGLLLGYLYRCTHRIWACWIVHISLNAISMIGFGLQILSGKPLSMLWYWFGI